MRSIKQSIEFSNYTFIIIPLMLYFWCATSPIAWLISWIISLPFKVGLLLTKLIYSYSHFIMQSILLHPIVGACIFGISLIGIFYLSSNDNPDQLPPICYLAYSILLPLSGCMLAEFFPTILVHLAVFIGCAPSGFNLWLLAECCLLGLSLFTCPIPLALLDNPNSEKRWQSTIRNCVAAIFNFQMIFFNPIRYPVNIVTPFFTKAAVPAAQCGSGEEQYSKNVGKNEGIGLRNEGV